MMTEREVWEKRLSRDSGLGSGNLLEEDLGLVFVEGILSSRGLFTTVGFTFHVINSRLIAAQVENSQKLKRCAPPTFLPS